MEPGRSHTISCQSSIALEKCPHITFLHARAWVQGMGPGHGSRAWAMDMDWASQACLAFPRFLGSSIPAADGCFSFETLSFSVPPNSYLNQYRRATLVNIHSSVVYFQITRREDFKGSTTKKRSQLLMESRTESVGDPGFGY